VRKLAIKANKAVKAGEDGVHIDVQWDDEIGAVIIDFGISGMCLPLDAALDLADRIMNIYNSRIDAGEQ
jgi:hypothetical protein